MASVRNRSNGTCPRCRVSTIYNPVMDLWKCVQCNHAYHARYPQDATDYQALFEAERTAHEQTTEYAANADTEMQAMRNEINELKFIIRTLAQRVI